MPDRNFIRIFGRSDPGIDAPEICRIQPYPQSTRTTCTAGWTAIARGWAEGDTRRCRLCPAELCNARDDLVCLVTVRESVPLEDAPLFSVADHLAGRGGAR